MFRENKKTLEEVIDVISCYTKTEKTNIKKNSRLKEDLDLSSFDLVSVMISLEENFCISIEKTNFLKNTENVKEVVDLILKHKASLK